MCRLAMLDGATAKQGHERAEAQEGPTKRPPHDRDASVPNGRADGVAGAGRAPARRGANRSGDTQGRRGDRSERQGGACAVGRGHAGREPWGS